MERHGPGTKCHIKFDDYAGLLFANVKLPGDAIWTRVSPDKARADLEASVQEEDSRNKMRFATKLVPGPSERLSVPILITGPNKARRAAHGPDHNMAAGPSGLRTATPDGCPACPSDVQRTSLLDPWPAD